MENFYTKDFGYTHNYEGPFYEDARSGTDVFYTLFIKDKDGKVVNKKTISFPSKPDYTKLDQLMKKQAEFIIRKIRPITDREAKRGFDAMRRTLNGESFKEFFVKNRFDYLRK
jgi:hypothetical protein